jgi:hypothetical protein
MTGKVATERSGLTRREMIRNAAAAGAVAWTAPVIIDSLASPAAAATPGPGFPCSYASIVFTIDGGSPVAVKIKINTTTCELTNQTSGDGNFTQLCNDATYSNSCSGNAICRDSSAVPAATSCPFTVNGGTVTANSGVSILFVVVHDATAFNSLCGPMTQFTAEKPDCEPTTPS